jgi:hypothetical protein
MSTPTPEAFKEKAAVIRKFLKEKYDLDVSQGHGLELISKIFGFKDWNTASALSKVEASKNAFPVQIMNFGDFRKATCSFADSDKIQISSDFLLREFLMTVTELNQTDGAVVSDSSLVLVDNSDGVASFRLNLENEDIVPVEDYRDMNGEYLYRNVKYERPK